MATDTRIPAVSNSINRVRIRYELNQSVFDSRWKSIDYNKRRKKRSKANNKHIILIQSSVCVIFFAYISGSTLIRVSLFNSILCVCVCVCVFLQQKTQKHRLFSEPKYNFYKEFKKKNHTTKLRAVCLVRAISSSYYFSMLCQRESNTEWLSSHRMRTLFIRDWLQWML